jgi:methyl-accepting chemotaxis protein
MVISLASSRVISWSLLQAVALPDTIIARTIPDRGVLEWTSGVLEIVVLLLAVGALASLILLLLAMREGLRRLNGTLERLTNDTQPMLANARAIVADARDMVATVKRDVGVVSEAAETMGETILDAARITAQRVDEVNALLDVVQDELEDTAITAIAAVRGVRLGAQELLTHLPRRRDKRRDRGDGRTPGPSVP